MVQLTDDDRKKINNFIDLITGIKTRPFITEVKKNFPSNIILPQPDAKEPDEELLRSFIMDVRQLYMESEKTSFKKMFPVLMKYAQPDEKIELQKCQNDYEENLKFKFPVGILLKESKTIKEILDDWLYGRYLHGGDKKKNTLANLGGFKNFYKWIFVDNLCSFVFEFAFALENLSKKLLYRYKQ